MADDNGDSDSSSDTSLMDSLDVNIIAIQEQFDNTIIYTWEDNDVAEIDQHEGQVITNFIENGCCSMSCVSQWSKDEILKFCADSFAIDYYENGKNALDQMLLGILRIISRTENQIQHARSLVSRERERITLKYLFKSIPVCKAAFMFLHTIKEDRLKRLLHLYKEDESILAPFHGNYRKLPAQTLTFANIQYICKFIQNYAVDNALFTQVRLPNTWGIVKLLPTNETKQHIYDLYKEAAATDNLHIACYASFTALWRDLCSDIVIMSPKTDLCVICQQNYLTHTNIGNLCEEKKTEFFQKCQKHLELVGKEREYYCKVVKETRERFTLPQILDRVPEPCTYDQPVHYSFDFCQQINIPRSPLQPGPVYFLVPYRVGIFGVMCDTVRRQCNFLIPESVTVSKGSTAVVSYLHSYFSNYNYGERYMHLHADNCIGQNKNNIVCWYLAYRIMKRLNCEIRLSFLPVRHTKFAPDYAFGIIKQLYNKSEAHTLNNLINIIDSSTPNTHMNFAKLCGDESGFSFIDVYDWATYFEERAAKKLPGITNYAHFHFSEKWPGQVKYKQELDGTVHTFKLFHKNTNFRDLPEVLEPVGLSDERRRYLYEKVRPFCREDAKNIVCPKPGTNNKKKKEHKEN